MSQAKNDSADTPYESFFRPAEPDLRGLKVLVAEDEAIIAMDLALILSGFGCRVFVPAPSIQSALVLLSQELPDAALLDLSLLDGLATPVAEALIAAGVPFALTTGWDRAEITEPALLGVPILRKPYDPVTLRQTLARLSERRAPSRP